MLFSCFLDLFSIIGLTKNDGELEILILRRRVGILQGKITTAPRIAHPERMLLAALTEKFAQSSDHTRQRFYQVMLIFKPDTVLHWHRCLVRHKWTFRKKGSPGRPKLLPELDARIVRLAKEDPRWGYEKIHGELLKLGHKISVSSVRTTLRRHRITPASQRSTGSWRSFLRHHKHQILACDFFTVETIWLGTIYVLFFIELGPRHIHLENCTTNPNSV